MGRPWNVVAVIYVAAMIGVIVGADLLFFRGHFLERLLANIGIVLVFVAFYLRFFRAIVMMGAVASGLGLGRMPGVLGERCRHIPCRGRGWRSRRRTGSIGPRIRRMKTMRTIALDAAAEQVSAELARRGIPPAFQVRVHVEVPEPHALAQAGGGFDWLAGEPELYTDTDLKNRA